MCENVNFSDIQKVKIMEVYSAGASVTLTAQLFGILRSTVFMIMNECTNQKPFSKEENRAKYPRWMKGAVKHQENWSDRNPQSSHWRPCFHKKTTTESFKKPASMKELQLLKIQPQTPILKIWCHDHKTWRVGGSTRMNQHLPWPDKSSLNHWQFWREDWEANSLLQHL